MKTILIVDDEPKITQIARDYLEHAGFQVTTASDGKAALAAVRTHKPDLVILDLGLPEMDGLDVTRAIRQDSNLPIIMLTARSEESDKLVGFLTARGRLHRETVQPERIGRACARRFAPYGKRIRQRRGDSRG